LSLADYISSLGAQGHELREDVTDIGTIRIPEEVNDDENHFTCSVEGCERTFRRPGDFRRHVVRHVPPKFKCIADDCYKLFYRKDKLHEHLEQDHEDVVARVDES